MDPYLQIMYPDPTLFFSGKKSGLLVNLAQFPCSWIRIRIKAKGRIRIRIKVKGWIWIRIRIKVMRIRNTG